VVSLSLPSMPRTPLHAALGETGASLNFTLIEQACANKLTERTDLDWKQSLPLTAGPGERDKKIAQQAELAKDIAAMANSGGGMIVYGVAESTVAGTSAADRVVPVGTIDETVTRAIRQVAGNAIYPPVTGTQLLPIAPEDAPDQGVLVLLVPDSLDAPHLIHQRNASEWFGVPYRHGPDTDWMVERQIATAYQAREVGRRRRTEAFNERFDRFVESCVSDQDSHWVVAMAVPETPLPRPRDLRVDQAHRVIDQAWQWVPRDRTGPKDLTQAESTRRGLQRYIRIGHRTLRAVDDATLRARIEVHGDGAVAVGFTRDGAFVGEGRVSGHVAVPDIEQTGLDLFALLWASTRALGVTSDYISRITVAPATRAFRQLDSLVDHFLPFDKSNEVFGYEAVDGPVLTSGGLEVALRSWLDIVDDAVNQTGYGSRLDPDEILLRVQMND